MREINIKRNSAFTLAEVIIVMGIIGIVAAVTIPSLMSNVNQNVFNSEQDLALKRIKAATDQMRTDDLITGYSTNDAFVDQFQKYIKTVKRCNSSNMQECFASTFQTTSGNNINLSNLHTGANLGQSSNTSQLVGLELINGVSLLLAFNPNCQAVNPYNDTVDTTSCMALVYDVNGTGKPNQIGKDISLLNATITTCDGVQVGGLCIAAADITYSPEIDPYGDGADYYQEGANDACTALGLRLPTKNELQTLIYPNKATIGGLSGSQYWAADGMTMYRGTVLNMAAGTFSTPFRYASGINARCVK